jgi:heat shock protein HslJ
VARWLLPVVLAASLSGTSWHVTRIAGEPVGEFNLRLHFADRRVSGNDGCNRYSARYRVTGALIRFRRYVSTAIGCEGTTIPSITDRLRRTRRYRIHGRRLELRRSGKTLVVLKRR